MSPVFVRTLSDLRLIHATTFMAQVKNSVHPFTTFHQLKSSMRALLEIYSHRHVHCKCGTLLSESQNNQEASEQVRRPYQERYALLTIPRYVIKKHLRRVPGHGQSSDRESYYKARKAFRKALSKSFYLDARSFTDRCRVSRVAAGNRVVRRNMQISGCARTQTPYGATRSESDRCEKMWAFIQGKTGTHTTAPSNREDYSEATSKSRIAKKRSCIQRCEVVRVHTSFCVPPAVAAAESTDRAENNTKRFRFVSY